VLNTNSEGKSLLPGVPFTLANILAPKDTLSVPSAPTKASVPNTSLSCTTVSEPILVPLDLPRIKYGPEEPLSFLNALNEEPLDVVPSICRAGLIAASSKASAVDRPIRTLPVSVILTRSPIFPSRTVLNVIYV